ncbi:MAG: AAA family ATPase [Lachnospiraceae bacterium]|nr:AAA family ATPase [Lachnospiraceae bacterium]
MIGRKKEQNELAELYESGKAELVAVYGRRRVGKTYLINEFFGGEFAFKHTGLSPAEINGRKTLKAQLDQFYISLKDYGLRGESKPESWQEAFYLLKKLLAGKSNGERLVVFIDELPWLDTPKSGFITGFESFWNGWASAQRDIMVIVCGSATSWMKDKLIGNYGGLYGRVTYELYLAPFTLRETEQFFLEKGIEFSRYDIVESYMIVGGIPYYLGYFKRHLSLAQNVDELFFKPHAKLEDEFNRLFASIFINPDRIKKIVEFLGSRRFGYKRGDIAEKLGLANNGKLSEDIDALISNGFVVRYIPFGYGGKEVHYKLVDSFCLFYIHFMKNTKKQSQNYWLDNMSSQAVVVWRGLAFENVCFNHIEQIKNALKIVGTDSVESAWVPNTAGRTGGMQIDMLIDRADNVVNLCEIKFYSNEIYVDKEMYLSMQERKAEVEKMISKKKAVRNTLITTYGIKKGEYSNIFANVIILDDLFV